jgi:integrase
MPLKIYRRKGRTVWEYRGTIAGHRRRGSTGTSDKTIAAQIASEIEHKIYKRHLDGPEEALTFAKAAARYIGAGKPQTFIVPLLKYWGNAKVKDMNAGAILQSAIDIYPNSVASSRNRAAIIPVQAIINHCAELGLCQHLRMKRLKVETKIKNPVTVEWMDKFCAASERPEIAALGLFMFGTGARISEALAVQWADIDFKAKTVLIRQTKIGNERKAHLPIRLLVALANLPRDKKPFPFATDVSAAYGWGQTIERAGIEPLTFHSCRHGFATALLHRGIDPVTIAKLGGWKSAAHVFQTYGHARNDVTLTDRIFDTKIDTTEASIEQDQSLTSNSKTPY